MFPNRHARGDLWACLETRMHTNPNRFQDNFEVSNQVWQRFRRFLLLPEKPDGDGQFLVFCQEGLMELVNQFGTMLLGANEMARLTPNSPPQKIQGNPDEIFDMSDESEKESLEIEFEDADGNKKSLIIDF